MVLEANILSTVGMFRDLTNITHTNGFWYAEKRLEQLRFVSGLLLSQVWRSLSKKGSQMKRFEKTIADIMKVLFKKFATL